MYYNTYVFTRGRITIIDAFDYNFFNIPIISVRYVHKIQFRGGEGGLQNIAIQIKIKYFIITGV